MPTATPELREEWKDDGTAIAFLESCGYTLTKRWDWVPPPDHMPTEKELRAIDYMFQEWDYGGVAMCCRCYDMVEVFAANCTEKPEALRGQPIGQYHCPDCGAMVMAGLQHPGLCQRCLDRKHPGFDEPPPQP